MEGVEPVDIPLAEPLKIETPRVVMENEQLEVRKELRSSVEGTIKEMIQEQAIVRTDPTANPDELDDVISSESLEDDNPAEGAGDVGEPGSEAAPSTVVDEMVGNVEAVAPEQEEIKNEQEPDVKVAKSDDLNEESAECTSLVASDQSAEAALNGDRTDDSQTPVELPDQPPSDGTEETNPVEPEDSSQVKDAAPAEVQQPETDANDLDKFMITAVEEVVAERQGMSSPPAMELLAFDDVTDEITVAPLTERDDDEEPVEVEPEESHEVIVFLEEVVAEAFAAFQERRELPPVEMSDAVLAFAAAACNQAIEDEEYDVAERIETDRKDLRRLLKAAESVPAPVPAVDLESRLEEVRQQQEQCELEWQQRIANFKEREQGKIDELEERQQVERETFEAQCQTQDFLQRFTKPSAALLQLWKLQKGLALRHDFEGAKEIKIRADKLQKRETIEAQQRAMQSVRQNFQRLLQKQAREMECAQANGNRKLAQLESEIAREREAKQKLGRQVETRLHDRRPARNRSVLPPLADSRDMKTPASHRRAATRAGRKEKEQTAVVLDVKMPNMKSVLGLRNPK